MTGTTAQTSGSNLNNNTQGLTGPGARTPGGVLTIQGLTAPGADGAGCPRGQDPNEENRCQIPNTAKIVALFGIWHCLRIGTVRKVALTNLVTAIKVAGTNISVGNFRAW